VHRRRGFRLRRCGAIAFVTVVVVITVVRVLVA
jgi:hypothetical protein